MREAKKRDGSPVVSGANATQALEGQKKKQYIVLRQDIAEITCYNCNKKCYYTKDCT